MENCFITILIYFLVCICKYHLNRSTYQKVDSNSAKTVFNNLKFLTRSRWQLKRLRAESPPVSEPRMSQGRVIKGSCDIIGRNSSRKPIILPNLVAIDTLVIEIWWFLFTTWPCKTTGSKLRMTLWLGACQGISPS